MNRTIKLFSAAEEQQALEMAVSYFGCEQDRLRTRVLTEGSELRDWLMLIWTTDSTVDPDNANGEYNLLYEEGGVYFELYPATGSGIEPEPDSVIEYIRRKGLEALDTEAAREVLKTGFGRAKIAPPQAENVLGEDIVVSVSDDEMEACIRFLPPDEGGAAITQGEIMEKVKLAGVVHGLKLLAIRDALKEKVYGRLYPIASGTLPKHGEDGRLTFHFDTEKKTGRPVGDEEGKLDFRSLALFEPVKEGQLLITRSLATEGTAGSTVRGAELKPKPGKDVNLPKTKNVQINEEKTAVYSEKNGLVEYDSGTVTVSDTYTISGDCDMSTGNIDFDGNIIIGGAVISGMLVKASGDITVGGVVNDAELIAGGNVNLKRGIQGMDKGKVTAGITVTAAFIERADIRAGEDVIADVILHSDIEAGRFLLLKGKRGNIMGGHARVGKEVIAKALGGASHVQTEIEVGLMPAKLERLKFLKDQLEALRVEEEKISQIEAYLSKSTNLPEDRRAALIQSVVDTRARSAQFMKEYSEEYNRLEYEAEHATDGKVHCTSTTYPGTKITIGKGIYRVNEQITYATFKYREGNVVFSECETSRQG